MHISNWWSTNPLRACRHYKSTLPDSELKKFYLFLTRPRSIEYRMHLIPKLPPASITKWLPTWSRSDKILKEKRTFEFHHCFVCWKPSWTRDQSFTFFRFWTSSTWNSEHEILECLVQIDHSSQQEIFTRTAVAWTTFSPIHANPTWMLEIIRLSKKDDSLSKQLERLQKIQG